MKGDDFMKSIFMRYPEGKVKALTFSYDDGMPQKGCWRTWKICT